MRVSRGLVLVTGLFLVLCGWRILYLASVVHDQRVYIDNGCQGRYQGQ